MSDSEKDYRKDVARHLRNVAELLVEHDLIRDPSPLTAAAGQVVKTQFDERWIYRVTDLHFKVLYKGLQMYKNTKPGDLESVELFLNVQVQGRCQDAWEWNDPFHEMQVDCTIRAEAEQVLCFDAWHLDREADPLGGSVNFVHPIYHFQYGGRQVEDTQHGEMLYVESPRIAHPPLDAILAVDFILSNYFPCTWIELREDAGYADAVAESQKRCWRPYALASSCNWQRPPAESTASWNAQHVWPQYVE